MEDEKVVQEGEVLVETPPKETQDQPFTPEQEAKIQGRLSDKERQLQSAKDREIAQIRREAEERVRRAESTSSVYESSFNALDEDARKEVELAQLRGRDQLSRAQEQQEQLRRGFYEVVRIFEGNMTQHITDLGIDPNDKDIDWGDRDSQNLTDRQSRILASVARVQKKILKAERDKLLDEVKEMNLKNRIELGLESHDTSASAGVGDASFTRKQLARMSPEEYEKLKPKIDKALREGRIRE